MSNFKSRLQDHIQTDEFLDSLLADIEATESPSARFKLRLDLLSYLEPKMKSVDPQGANTGLTIELNYHEVTKPDEDRHSATPNEVPPIPE